MTAYILFAAVFTFFTCWMAGRLLLSGLKIKLYREEDCFLSFVTGSALLSTLVFLLTAAHLAYQSVFLLTGTVIILCGLWRGTRNAERFEPLSLRWKLLFMIPYAAFGLLYLVLALGPEVSPDGTAYRVGLVSRYYHAHSFPRITTSMFASLSQGVEMLFLFAFPFGRQAATAIIEFLFLLMLPFGTLCFGRRCKRPHAGVLAALMVFTAPVVGRAGTIAYVDVATACVVFGGFYLVMIWRENSGMALLVPVGLVCGFAYCSKYTAFPILIYAFLVVVWNARGARLKYALVLSMCMLAMMAPWLIKNWVYVDNPFAPFLNQLFPNQYMDVGFEREFARSARHMSDVTVSEIPLEVTIKGARLSGLIGPIFLLAPLGLLAARNAAGRYLLAAAAIMLAPYFLNIGTRFLIPVLPFVALAIAFALSYEWLLMGFVAVAAIGCWPGVVGLYCDEYAWRIEKRDYELARCLRPEADRIRERIGESYDMGLVLENTVPVSEPIFSLGSFQRSYHTRDVIVAYESAFGNRIHEMLAAAIDSGRQYRWKVRLRLPVGGVKAWSLRVHPAASSKEASWGVGEVHVFSPAGELERRPEWRFAAREAFDGNPLTQWSTRQPFRPEHFIAVDFRSPLNVTEVVLDCSPDSSRIPIAMEYRGESGPWISLTSTVETFEAAPSNLRKLAAQTLKSRGIRWLLVSDREWGANDYDLRREEWDLTLHSHIGQYKLFAIQ